MKKIMKKSVVVIMVAAGCTFFFLEAVLEQRERSDLPRNKYLICLRQMRTPLKKRSEMREVRVMCPVSCGVEFLSNDALQIHLKNNPNYSCVRKGINLVLKALRSHKTFFPSYFLVVRSLKEKVVSVESVYQDIKKLVDQQFQTGTYQNNYDTSLFFTADELLKTVDAFVVKMKESLDQAWWLTGGTKDSLFVRKRILPVDSEIEFRGDLHGDVRSLIRWLDDLRKLGWFEKDTPFTLAHKNCYLAFLGDYTDRGHYGAEVMYIIMQLFLHNPDNVLIVRGNHEDAQQVHRYGFLAEVVDGSYSQQGELFEKFGKEFKFREVVNEKLGKIIDVYSYLPVVLFLGCSNEKDDAVDFIQCCHGGMEPLYNSRPLLEDSRKDLYEWFDEKIQNERDSVSCVLHSDISDLLEMCDCNQQKDREGLRNGFQWNDFDFFNEKPDVTWKFRQGRGRVLHKKLTTEILKHAGGKNNVWSVFRAHQHNSDTLPHILKYGNGLYKLWSEKTTQAKDWGNEKETGNIQWTGDDSKPVPLEKYSVWTFNVAPRTGYYEDAISALTYDTVARLTLKSGFDKWTLQPRKINVGCITL